MINSVSPVSNKNRSDIVVKLNLIGIQILRALAAVLVIIHHVLEESTPLFVGGLPRPLVLIGACGVDIFFVISGFIMLHTNYNNFGRPGAASTFIKRRFLRIYPIYWICILLVLAAKCFGLYNSLDITLVSIISSASLVPIFKYKLIHGVAWTLVFEVYFYLCFAIFIKSSKPWRAQIGLVLFLCANFIISNMFPNIFALQTLSNPIIFEFTLGVAIALLFRELDARCNIKCLPLPGLILLSTSLLIAGTFLAPGLKTSGIECYSRVLNWGLPSALLVFSFLGITQASSLITRFLVYLGDASYSLYLFHPFVMTAYAKVIKSVSIPESLVPAALVLATATSLIIGIGAYQYIERPLLRFSQKLR